MKHDQFLKKLKDVGITLKRVPRGCGVTYNKPKSRPNDSYARFIDLDGNIWDMHKINPVCRGVNDCGFRHSYTWQFRKQCWFSYCNKCNKKY